jgi:zinc protease
LQDNLIKPPELERAVKQARALFAYGSENITNQAFWMGYSNIFADYEWYTQYVDRLSQVTPEMIMEAAQKYLQPESRVIGIYLPGTDQVTTVVEEE